MILFLSVQEYLRQSLVFTARSMDNMVVKVLVIFLTLSILSWSGRDAVVHGKLKYRLSLRFCL